mgnify:FL=1
MSKIKEYLVNFFNGFMMALADSVPGVSGGTIAFLLGFYDNFINALDSLLNKNKRLDGIKYLLKICIGWIVGMGLSVLILSNVFEKHIYQVSSLFIGFILASIPIIFKEEKDTLKKNYFNVIFLVLGIVIVFLITYFNNTKLADMSLSNLTLSHSIYIFIVGMIAISAMILPGISGSTLLLIFGLYLPIINGIKDLLHFNFNSFIGLFVFGLGVITGILSIIKLLKKALDKYRNATIYLIIGLMIGSIYSIIEGPTTLDVPVDALNFNNVSILFFMIGSLIVIGLQWFKKFNNKENE